MPTPGTRLPVCGLVASADPGVLDAHCCAPLRGACSTCAFEKARARLAVQSIRWWARVRQNRPRRGTGTAQTYFTTIGVVPTASFPGPTCVVSPVIRTMVLAPRSVTFDVFDIRQ
jgi:hypothetical protein